MANGEVTPGIQNLINIAEESHATSGNRGEVRVQLQTGNMNISSISLVGGSTGVTKLQATGGLAYIWAGGIANDASLATNPSYNAATVKLSAKINELSGGGLSAGGNALRESFVHKGQMYRIDVEINQGTHLVE